jgi:hypothetical protein
MSKIINRLQKIKKAIWQRRPILGDIMKGHGQMSLYDYAEDFLDVNKSPRLDERKGELINSVKDLIKKRLGDNVAEEVAKQLAHLPLVSTADHHSPIQHPFWVNANIISSLPYIGKNDPLLKYLVVFSFASVSLNNASGYARGLLFHVQENSGDLISLPILPDKAKMSVVYSTRAFNREDLDKTEAQLFKKTKDNILSLDRAEKIKEIIEKYFGDKEVLNSESIKEQITKINFKMWPDLFHRAATESNDVQSRHKLPDLIYLEIETLVSDLLIHYHLFNNNSLIHKFLFDPQYQALIPSIFNNIPGAFSLENEWGTYLFWAIDDKQHRVRMFLSEGELHSTYRRHTCKFSPEGVRQSLENKEIFPSMLLCYLIISLYYGFKCLGGFCQVNDLTITKLAWQKLLKMVGENAESEAVQPIQTKELGGDGMVLAYLRSESGDIQPASGIDMILRSQNTFFDKYYDRSKQVTLEDMMNPMLPEMYTVLYSQEQRDPLLTELTVYDIVKELNIKDKI